MAQRTRQEALVIVAALAAFAAVAVMVSYRLYPSTEAIASNPVRISSSEAVERARKLAKSYGRDVTGWETLVVSTRDWFADEVRPAAPAMARERIHVQAYEIVFVRGPQRVTVKILGHGVPAEFAYRDARQPQIQGAPLSEEQEKMLLTDFGCHDHGHYRKVSSVDSARIGHVTTWEWREAAMPEFAERFEVLSAVDGVHQAVLRQDWSSAIQQRWLSRIDRRGARFFVYPAVIMVGVTVTCSFFFPAWARGRLRIRAALWLAFLLIVVQAAAFFASSGWMSLVNSALQRDQPVPEAALIKVVSWLAVAVWVGAAWAVGRSRAGSVEAHRERWRTLDALLQGRVWRREVGLALAAGVLAGVVFAAAPSVLSATGWFANPLTTTVDVSWLVAWWPAATPFAMDFFDAAVWLSLGGALLAATSSGRWAWLGWAIFVAIGSIALGSMRSLMNDDMPGIFATGAALAAGLATVYWRVDLLAAWTAGFAFWAARLTLFLWLQPAREIESAGVQSGLTWAVLALFGVAAIIWARPLEVEEEEAVSEVTAQRELLEAEFSLARQAQERLLPAVPARLGTYTLAAACHPARDVGGDLYDFFRFPDGSYGICVADVSGKGVPASLYMTMTKGILAAASRDEADLRGLAVALNGYLCAAGKRRTFVTMALGRFDPRSGVLEHIRAGHNSILWRRAGSGECSFVKPRGVGLGLSPGALFERALELRRLELAPGDAVVFYSDGITEAMNGRREQFGEERLEQVVAAHAHLDAEALQGRILDAVRAFMGKEPPHDDMTLFVLRA